MPEFHVLFAVDVLPAIDPTDGIDRVLEIFSSSGYPLGGWLDLGGTVARLSPPTLTVVDQTAAEAEVRERVDYCLSEYRKRSVQRFSLDNFRVDRIYSTNA